MIGHCIEVDVEIKWGEVDVFWYQTWNFTKKYCQFHVQQPITSRMSNHLRAIWHYFYIILSTWLSKLYTG
jgi:hypothetical protein